MLPHSRIDGEFSYLSLSRIVLANRNLEYNTAPINIDAKPTESLLRPRREYAHPPPRAGISTLNKTSTSINYRKSLRGVWGKNDSATSIDNPA